VFIITCRRRARGHAPARAQKLTTAEDALRRRAASYIFL